jgi:hypothetical protein
VTDAFGHYQLVFEPEVDGGPLQVVALAKSQDPQIQVVDNTDGKAIWGAGEPLDPAGGTVDIHAQHGWTGTDYDPTQRRAAPFAILDSMYTAAHAFMAVRPVTFPPLVVNWSPENTPEIPPPGSPCTLANGCIGTSHYDPGDKQIYVLGKAGVDTDEFDSHVIVHEWGHFLEANQSRSDSPGGIHYTDDILDPRLALGEGWGDAVPAMVLPETTYADSYFSTETTLDAFGFDAETTPTPTDDPNPGPFSEMSVMRLLYDIYDSGTNESYDKVALGLGAIYDVLAGPEKGTAALTTIASVVAGLEAQGAKPAALNTLLSHYNIGPITTAFGDGDPSLRSMYLDVSSLPYSTQITLDGPADTYWSGQMRGQNRYFVFTGTVNGGQVLIRTTSSQPVAISAYHRGLLAGPTGHGVLLVPTIAGETYVAVITENGSLNGTYPVTVSLSAL